MLPWLPVDPLPPADYARVRRRAIFDYCKWNAQVEDVPAMAPFPLVLRAAAWQELADHARALARETLAAEAALAARPELHRRLGLPWAVRRALRRVRDAGPALGAARLIRFDFHHTTDGWRISEANTDVPGGINEASGLPELLRASYGGTVAVGHPGNAYAAALRAAGGAGARVALLHATGYSDDRQVMTFLAGLLEAAGLRPVLASPAHLRWRAGRAALETEWASGPVDLIARFFPAEWLTQLPAPAASGHYFAAARTPASNPAAALLTQSKRFPLVWEELGVALPRWRALLPETRDPRDAPWRDSEDWVLKPALGRVGDGVAMRELMRPREWRRLRRTVRLRPGQWAAQRRFEATPLAVDGQRFFPCVGVFTIDDQVAGAYGRLARRPLIDWRAQDAAVLATTNGAHS